MDGGASVGSDEGKRRGRWGEGGGTGNSKTTRKRGGTSYAKCAQKERENVASPGSHRTGERSVHSLSDRRLKATLNEMNAFTCLLRLPRRIHSLFHFKRSAALFWVAALSPRPPRGVPITLSALLPSRALGLTARGDSLPARKFRERQAAARSRPLADLDDARRYPF